MKDEVTQQIQFNIKSVCSGSDINFRSEVIYEIVKDFVLDDLEEYIMNDVNIPEGKDKLQTAMQNYKRGYKPVID